MPYIPKRLRAKIDSQIDKLLIALKDGAIAEDNCSEVIAKMLTYTFFKIIVDIYANERCGWYLRGDVEKICKSVAREFEKRFIDLYEDKKRKQYGDVR